MPNDTPGRDAVPGWGQPTPEPPPDAPAVPAPEEPGPADVPWPVEADAPDAPAAPDAPTAPWPSVPDPAPPPVAPWGATPAQPAAPTPSAPAPAAPTTWGVPGASPTQPPAAAPAGPAGPTTWGVPAQPAAPAAPAPAAPTTWGAPVQPAAPSAPAAPASSGAWGAPVGSPLQQPLASAQPPVPQQQPPTPGAWAPPPSPSGPSWGAPAGQQPPGAWGAPPPQGGWTPGGPGAPGGPPVGWAPAPAKSSNGCLKGCLIVGAIGIVLLIILFIAISILGAKFAQDLGVGPDGTVAQCPLVSNADLASVLGGDAQSMPLGGLVDATIGQLLDKRIIPDAEDCWIAGSRSATGRIARQTGGDASGAFRAAKDAAKSGGYFAGDASGIGDEAFCTGVSEAISFGVLVRSGDRLVYVSLIGTDASSSANFETNADGVVTSPETCKLAQEVARKVLR